MKIPSPIFILSVLICGLSIVAQSRAQTAPSTNSVSGAVFDPSAFTYTAYIVNAQNNPTLTLYRGVTYVFQVNAGALHPFYIRTNSNFAAGSLYLNGVTGQGATAGNLTFAVPVSAPNQLIYQCGNHSAMQGFLNIIDPPAPPTVKIVYIAVTDTNITMLSTGAADWSPIPEYSSNLTANIWETVPGFLNSFSNGTNTTMFDRLDPICGPNVFLRVRNQKNN